MADGLLGLRRHDMARVIPAAWHDALTNRPDLAGEVMLRDWAAQGRPLVVRRRLQGDRPDIIPLALPLPPSAGKKRIAFALAGDALAEIRRPPRLSDAQAAAPPLWRDAIAAILLLAPRTRVFGSLAWHYMTGLPYLTAQSDLDLLFDHDDATISEALLTELRRIEQDAPMRLDGEIVARDGSAAQWREVASGAGEIITKRLDRVATLSRSLFLQGQEASCPV